MIRNLDSFPYETLFDLVTDGIIILEHTKILACNSIILNWLGYCSEELIGSDLSKIIPTEEAFLVKEIGSIPARNLSSSRHFFSLLNKDQKNKVFVVANTSLVTQGNWSGHCIMTLHNITREKMFENLLNSSQQRLQEVIETFPDIYYVTDAKGILIKVSPSVKDILGYEPQEVLGTPMVTYYEKPELRDILLGQVLAAKGKYVRIEAALMHKSGYPVWFNTRARILFDSDGNITGLEGLARDATVEKNAQDIIECNEKELVKIKKNLEEKVNEQTQELLQKERLWLQQSRHAQMGEMISSIAHQWRQPLFVLSLWVDNISSLTAAGNLDKEVLQEFSKKAHNLIQSMSRTIDEFKNFFKPRTAIDSFNLGQAIFAATELIHPSLVQSNIKLDLTNLDNVCIQGYQNEFGQVIINLLTNAKEALIERKTAKPKINVLLKVENQTVVIEVSDNSGGIPPEILDKIFDPYFTTKKLGTGIGLYMSKSIIEKHMKGQISVFNSESGAIFKISIPLFKFAEDCPQCSSVICSTANSGLPEDKLSIKSEGVRLDNIRVLFVDDSEDTREIFDLMLKKNGADVKTVCSPKECLHVLPNFKPHLIISDISMPEEDGFSLIKKIRAFENENDKRIPAIALSAHIDEDQIQHALKVGFQKYIRKPVDWKTLVHLIKELTLDEK